MAEPEVRIRGGEVRILQGRRTLAETRVGDLVGAIVGAVERRPSCGVLPRGVRLWLERRDVVGMAIEVDAQPRNVRWLAKRSRAAFGHGARYETYYLSFPYLVLLLVLRRGQLTGMHQLYYRRASLDHGEELLLPNLYNVAQGYEQRCWLCLEHAPPIGSLPWARKVETVVEHVFFAAFNRSAEAHEGNSYWSKGQALDPRVKTPEAWQAATRQNPWFALDVPWQPAGTTASEELRSMLDRVVAPTRLDSSLQLSGLVANVNRAQAVP